MYTNISNKKNSSELGVATPVAIIMALIFALIAGTGVYIWSNMQKDATEVLELRKQIAELNTTSKKLDETAEDKQDIFITKGMDLPLTDAPTSCTVCDDLPVIIYTPGGIFSDAEKTSIKQKLTDPFFDYHNQTGIEYITMIIEKYEPLPAHGYKYNVTAISKSGGYQGFLYGQSSPLEWWVPECMGGCNLSDEFKEKYPEIVDILE